MATDWRGTRMRAAMEPGTAPVNGRGHNERQVDPGPLLELVERRLAADALPVGRVPESVERMMSRRSDMLHGSRRHPQTTSKRDAKAWPPGDPYPGDAAIAALLGVTRETVQRWRSGRTRPRLFAADAMAVRLGLHPAAVWGEQWWEVSGRGPR